MGQGHIVNVPEIGYVDVALLIRQHAEAKQEVELLRRTVRAMDSEWIPSQPVPPQLASVLDAVVSEYWRAKVKHGEKTMDGPGYTLGQRLAILVEEGGEVSEEVANAALQALIGAVGHSLTYDQPDVEGGHLGRLFKELIQVTTMAATWATTLVPGPTVPVQVSPDHNIELDGGCAACESESASSASDPKSEAVDELVPVAGTLYASFGDLGGQVELDANGRATLEMPDGARLNVRVVRSNAVAPLPPGHTR